MSWKPFLETDLVSKTNPFIQFSSWFSDAKREIPEYAKDASLATSTRDGIVSNRFVQVDSFSEEGFVFYTSTEGRKAKDLEQNPHCAITFYWPTMQQRVVRIEGVAKVLPDDWSENYFRSLPFENQIALAAAPQSHEVSSREELDAAFTKLADEYKESGKPVPKPPTWKGYQIVPTWVEFFQAQPSFLADRLVFTRPLGGDRWELKRLVS